MILGIVGSEQAKFTPETEEEARRAIRDLFDIYFPDLVVSGACHLGGVDAYAVEEATRCGIAFREYAPARQNWSGGYRERNLEIAHTSDVVVCITVRNLPPNYAGMRFARCYHCGTDGHVKSGGCWTVKQAIKLGREGKIIVI